MGYQINNSPDSTVKWADTPIAFQLESFDWDTYDDYYWLVTIKKETGPGTSVYEDITERIVRPAPDGFVSINISPVLAGFLRSVDIDFSDPLWISKCYPQQLNYAVVVQEFQDGSGQSPVTISGATLRGVGQASRNFDMGNVDFFDATAGTFKYLTDTPSGKRVFPGQPEFLRAMVSPIASNNNTYIRFKVNWTDGTSALYSNNIITNIDPLDILAFNAGYNALPHLINLTTSQNDALDKEVESWEVTVVAGSGVVEFTETFTYILEDCAHSPYLRYIVWENQQGGWDTKAVMGEMNMTEETSKRLVNSIIDPNDFGTARSQITYGTETNQVMEFNTGWMLDEELEWVKGLLRSNHIYLCADNHHPNDAPQGAHTPILITGSSIQLHRDDQFLRSFTFTASKAIPQPGI